MVRGVPPPTCRPDGRRPDCRMQVERSPDKTLPAPADTVRRVTPSAHENGPRGNAAGPITPKVEELGPVAATLRGEAPNGQHQDGTQDRDDPGLERPELFESDPEDCGTDPSADQCADDAEKQRHQPSAALPTRQNGLRDGSCNKAQDNPTDDTHGLNSVRHARAPL